MPVLDLCIYGVGIVHYHAHSRMARNCFYQWLLQPVFLLLHVFAPLHIFRDEDTGRLFDLQLDDFELTNDS